MAADLSHLHSFLPPPPPVCDRFCPLVLDLGSLCSPGSDSGLSSPLTSSEALTSIDEDHEHDHLAELTRLMANDTLQDQNDEGHKNPGSVPAAIASRDMPRWADLFAVSPQSTLWSSSGSSYRGKKAPVPDYKSLHENSGTDGDHPSWNTPTAYEPGTTENSDMIEPVQTMSCHDMIHRNNDLKPGLHSNQTLQNDRNWTKEFNICPERAPKQANSAKRKPLAKNNHWRTRRGIIQGECYVGPSLLHQQKTGYPNAAGSDMRAVFLGDPNSRTTSSTGTGVFLPKTAGNPTEQGRKPRCSTVLIPARVAQALMLHFSKMSHHQSQSSAVGGGGGVGYGCFPIPIHPDSSERGPNFQQKSQAKAMPEPAINCNEMGLPQEWMY